MKKLRILTALMLTFSTAIMATPVRADAFLDYSNSVSRGLKRQCSAAQDVEMQLICTNILIDIKKVQLEHLKDQGCLQQRSSHEDFGSAILAECEERLAEWDKKHPSISNQRETETLPQSQNF